MKIFYILIITFFIFISWDRPIWSVVLDKPPIPKLRPMIIVALPPLLPDAEHPGRRLPKPQPQAVSIATEFIKSFESFSPTTYMDADRVAIGYGFCRYAIPDLKWGDTITRKQADKVLVEVMEEYKVLVLKTVKVDLTENQIASLISLSYNIGETSFRTCHVVMHLNRGNYDLAANSFQHWKNSNGKELAGLVRRREAEKKMFRS